MENTRGSEWRKWDLHVHTPYSHLNNNYGNTTDEAFIKKIKGNCKNDGLSVIGLTNYFNFCDNDYNLKDELEKNGIVTFLNLELRLTYQNKEDQCCDIHVIFDNTTGKDVIQAFLSNLTVKVNGNEKKAATLCNNDFTNATIEFEHLKKTLEEQALNLQGKYLLGFLSRGHGNGRTSTQYEQLANKCHLLIHSSNSQQNIDDDRGFWLQYNKPLLRSSDAHSVDKIGSKFTWIKADTTFDGLKQIIYEPKERVKVQEENPKYDFEKSPFTEISIRKEVKLFSKDELGNVYNDDDNISFSKTTIPLNENLVSIIGGRGTGKSRLIDYISVNLGKKSKLKSEYTQSEDIIVKRATSLKENEKEFSLAESNSIPFMYISQSEIKDVVENNGKFTAKIREIIGISSDYSADENNIKEATQLLNEYSNLAGSLFADGTTSDLKKTEFEEQIKRYENFITNVTSEENKEKLTKYKESLETLNNYKKKQITAEELKTKIKNNQDELNSEIKALNSQIGEIISDIQIPQIDNQEIINYIDTSIINPLKYKIEELQNNIDSTKNNFPNYKGDLASLLDNIQKYQNQVNELKAKKSRIDEGEAKMKELISTKLKQLGEEIKKDVFQYKTDIETKWKTFISGKESYTDKQKELLKNVLGTESKGKEYEKDKIELSVNIDFDENKFYAILTEKLDKRTWKKDFLKTQLGINNFDDFISFITQPFKVDSFDNNVSVINNILECIYLKYTDYISHRIEILVNNKSLKKLSVGQKGTIYLRLQLAANLFSETIIYDQPEDDLDNKFINESLVDLFKSIKKYRQVIIVSHNANLVVNADSEQIIVAENNNGILSYHSGAMENKEINEKICEILEGGQEAFEKREKKYGLK